MEAIKTLSYTVASSKIQQITAAGYPNQEEAIAGHKAYVFRNICIKIGYALGNLFKDSEKSYSEREEAGTTYQTLSVDVIIPEADTMDVIKELVARIPEKERPAFIRNLKKQL